MAQRSHVPKFGNWDGDNVPYTAYFENARKEKTNGIRINPNDPEQNPEAFNIINGGNFDRERNNDQQHKHKDGGSRRTFSSGSSSKGSSANPMLKPKHQSKKSGSSNPNNSDDDFGSSNPKVVLGMMKWNRMESYRSSSVPKFGQWDENDPRSGEGFTVIFNKVKEEKHIAAAKFPPIPLHSTINNYQPSQEKETKKKCCCGLF